MWYLPTYHQERARDNGERISNNKYRIMNIEFEGEGEGEGEGEYRRKFIIDRCPGRDAINRVSTRASVD